MSKKVDDVTAKEIFFTLFPDGYKLNPLYGDLNPNELQYYVTCAGKCGGNVTRSKVKSSYGNPVVHAKSCYGETNIEQLVREVRAVNNDDVGNSASKRQTQTTLFSALLDKPTPSENALNIWMGLVCKYNTPITRMSDKVFCSYLTCEETSYRTFVATMLELSFIVEAKIHVEMKGKVGTILHDGWSKYSRHYIALLASYMVNTGKRDGNGKRVMKSVITLLTCSTLPYNDNEVGDDNEGDLCHFDALYCML